jgi:hypothetical protein
MKVLSIALSISVLGLIIGMGPWNWERQSWLVRNHFRQSLRQYKWDSNTRYRDNPNFQDLLRLQKVNSIFFWNNGDERFWCILGQIDFTWVRDRVLQVFQHLNSTIFMKKVQFVQNFSDTKNPRRSRITCNSLVRDIADLLSHRLGLSFIYIDYNWYKWMIIWN